MLNASDASDPILTLAELESYTGISRKVLHHWCKRGLPHYRLTTDRPSIIRVRLAEFNAWMESIRREEKT